jgi:Holliday junction resolvase
MEKLIQKPKPRTESSILHGVTAALTARGWRVKRMGASIYGGKGTPDLFCIRHGISVWIEIKNERGKLSREQQAFGYMVDAGGGIYIVARNEEYAVRVTDSILIAFSDINGKISHTMRPMKGMRLVVEGEIKP